MVVGATAAAVGALVATPTGVASAASACWPAGFDEPGPSGSSQPSFEAFYCNNVPGTDVYSEAQGDIAGTLRGGTNWFVCDIDDSGYVGGEHPYRSEYTEADNGAWGWVKDTSIISETNPLSPCYG